jgi:hypothetical protein
MNSLRRHSSTKSFSCILNGAMLLSCIVPAKDANPIAALGSTQIPRLCCGRLTSLSRLSFKGSLVNTAETHCSEFRMLVFGLVHRIKAPLSLWNAGLGLHCYRNLAALGRDRSRRDSICRLACFAYAGIMVFRTFVSTTKTTCLLSYC